MTPSINTFESESVIFLDIDGVLNNDDAQTENGEYIVSEYVQNLAKLVELTNAKIVLTSSWRKGLIDWINNNFCEEDFYANHYKQLLLYFAHNNLHIADVVPVYQNVASKDMFSKIKHERPLAIQEWLQKNPNIKHFVILDDEETWDWGNLRDHLVLTSHRSIKTPFGEYGLKCVESTSKGFRQEKIAEAVDVLKIIRSS